MIYGIAAAAALFVVYIVVLWRSVPDAPQLWAARPDEEFRDPRKRAG